MKRIGFVIAAVATGAILVLGGVWAYVTFFVGEAPAELSLPDPTSSPQGPGPKVSHEAVKLDGAWVVESGVGGYRVQEVLNGADHTVVGRTEEVSGSLAVEGGVLMAGEIVVALGSVATDSAARDIFYRGHFDTGDFPDAVFAFDPGIDVSGLDSGAISVTVLGKLTMHGVTLDEVARIEARRDGAAIVVVGSIDVDYTRYGVPAPELGFAVVEPLAVIEARLTFEPAA
jgi:polyisoprenoid-binding protein YceI